MSKYSGWKSCHAGKRRFASTREAQRVVWKIWWRERRIDWSLHPYVCRWTNDYRAGRSGPPHIHIGHNAKQPWKTPEDWLRYHWRRAAVWPYFRLRRRYRRLRRLVVLLVGRVLRPSNA